MTATAAPARSAIPYGRQVIDDDDIAAVVAVMRGDRITQGPAVEEFEAAIARYTGATHAVAVANGTAALHAACVAAGLGPGDRVGVPALTFVASANCVRYVGATPVPLDVDPLTWNLDVAAIDPTLDGIIAVHFAGLPVDLARVPRRPRIVIEDGAHALGAATPTSPVGSCADSDLTTFSFHPVKPITTAEGGMVTTNDPDLAERLRRCRSHGMERGGRRPGDYDIVELGFNLRLSDLHAALGRSQLTKLERFRDRRHRLVERYRTILADSPVGLPPVTPAGFTHAQHLFPVLVADRDRVVTELVARGIGVQVHYRPWHLHRFSPDTDAGRGDLPVAEHLADHLVSLPLHPALTDREQDRVAATLLEIVR